MKSWYAHASFSHKTFTHDIYKETNAILKSVNQVKSGVTKKNTTCSTVSAHPSFWLLCMCVYEGRSLESAIKLEGAQNACNRNLEKRYLGMEKVDMG